MCAVEISQKISPELSERAFETLYHGGGMSPFVLVILGCKVLKLEQEVPGCRTKRIKEDDLWVCPKLLICLISRPTTILDLRELSSKPDTNHFFCNAVPSTSNG